MSFATQIQGAPPSVTQQRSRFVGAARTAAMMLGAGVALAMANVSGSPAWAGVESLTTADGLELAAQSWGAGERAVLLLHEADRDRGTWGTFSEKLVGAGFQVLALDLRGHGDSDPGPLTDADYPKMVADVDAGVAWLKSKGAAEVMVVGAALGANLALNAASDNTDITHLVLLSPALNAKGVKVSSAIASYGDRPMLLVASDTDVLSTKAANFLASRATGNTQLQLYSAAGGSRMLNAVPDLEPMVVGWLNGSYAQGDGHKGARANVKTGDVGDVEVRGTRLEDRVR